jgi:hypothetical protein
MSSKNFIYYKVTNELFFFFATGVWNQGLATVQPFDLPALFALASFSDRILHLCLCWLQTAIYNSCIAGLASMYRHAWPTNENFKRDLCLVASDQGSCR